MYQTCRHKSDTTLPYTKGVTYMATADGTPLHGGEMYMKTFHTLDIMSKTENNFMFNTVLGLHVLNITHNALLEFNIDLNNPAQAINFLSNVEHKTSHKFHLPLFEYEHLYATLALEISKDQKFLHAILMVDEETFKRSDNHYDFILVATFVYYIAKKIGINPGYISLSKNVIPFGLEYGLGLTDVQFKPKIVH